jgi:prepilin-type N-terminal cleavage/methylation domain-containing protein
MIGTRNAGFSLVEILVVLGIFGILAGIAIPNLKAYTADAHLLGGGRIFKGEFLKARSVALKTGRYTAIRFESGPHGPCFSVYRDEDHDGVRSDDIQRGRDIRIAGPFPLTGNAPGVRVGINPGVPAIPPDSGSLDPESDPIRFGRSRMVSFSPLGEATPGTFYLASDGGQAAVRVTGNSARVRLMVWRGGRWRQR